MASPSRRPAAFTRWSRTMEARTVGRGSPVRRANQCMRASSPARAGTTVDAAKPTSIALKAWPRVAARERGRTTASQRAAWKPTAVRLIAAARMIKPRRADFTEIHSAPHTTSWNVQAAAARSAATAPSRSTSLRRLFSTSSSTSMTSGGPRLESKPIRSVDVPTSPGTSSVAVAGAAATRGRARPSRDDS